MKDGDDFGPEIEDESSLRMRFGDWIDRGKEWWQHNITRRARSAWGGMHMSKEHNNAMTWWDVYRLLRLALGMASVATVAFVLLGVFRGKDAAYYLQIAGTVGVALMVTTALTISARRRAHIPAHRKTWIPNMWRPHITKEYAVTQDQSGELSSPPRWKRPKPVLNVSPDVFAKAGSDPQGWAGSHPADNANSILGERDFGIIVEDNTELPDDDDDGPEPEDIVEWKDDTDPVTADSGLDLKTATYAQMARELGGSLRKRFGGKTDWWHPRNGETVAGVLEELHVRWGVPKPTAFRIVSQVQGAIADEYGG